MWVERWFDVIADEPELPGVWKRRDGGYHVRTRVTDPRTGKRREINKQLPDVARAKDALVWLEAERAKILDASKPDSPASVPQFHDFAATVFERKVALGRIVSAKGIEKWKWVLEKHLVPAFGDLFVDQLTTIDVKKWQTGFASKIRAGTMKPATANTILGVLRQITDEIVDDFDVRDPLRGVEPFGDREHSTYTDECPNSLLPADVPRFLAEARVRFPQHYAMVFLGITTGLRPSSLRALRRRGPSADVKWDEGRLLVRRSYTIGPKAMNATKTGRDQVIDLDPYQLSVLRWHCEQLDARAEKLAASPRSAQNAAALAASDLLFPAAPTRWSRGGGYRPAGSLRKVFAELSKVLELGYPISPRAMRRTFQDLARAAKVHDVVTRSISGHATPAMQRRYSTVGGEEQREGMGKIIDIATARVDRVAGRSVIAGWYAIRDVRRNHLRNPVPFVRVRCRRRAYETTGR